MYIGSFVGQSAEDLLLPPLFAVRAIKEICAACVITAGQNINTLRSRAPTMRATKHRNVEFFLNEH